LKQENDPARRHDPAMSMSRAGWPIGRTGGSHHPDRIIDEPPADETTGRNGDAIWLEGTHA
jgi:hypothetical protein